MQNPQIPNLIKSTIELSHSVPNLGTLPPNALTEEKLGLTVHSNRTPLGDSTFALSRETKQFHCHINNSNYGRAINYALPIKDPKGEVKCHCGITVTQLRAIINQMPLNCDLNQADKYLVQALAPLVSSVVSYHKFTYCRQANAIHSGCGALRLVASASLIMDSSLAKLEQYDELRVVLASMLIGTRIRKVVFPWTKIKDRRFWIQVFTSYAWFNVKPDPVEGRWVPDWSSFQRLKQKLKKKLKLKYPEAIRLIRRKAFQEIKTLSLPSIPKVSSLCWETLSPAKFLSKFSCFKTWHFSSPISLNQKKSPSLRVLYTNAGSLTKDKLSQLRAINARTSHSSNGASLGQNLDVICLTEVRTAKHLKPLTNGFDIVHLMDPNRYGAGAVCMIKKNIVRDSRLKLVDHNSIILVIYPAGMPMVLACFYAENEGKNARSQVFLEMVASVASQLDDVPICIVGDFNIKESSMTSMLKENWELHVHRGVHIIDPEWDTWKIIQEGSAIGSKYTKFASWKRKNKFSRIDYVLSNVSARAKTFEGISDHLTFIVDLPLEERGRIPRKKIVKVGKIMEDLSKLATSEDILGNEDLDGPIVRILKHLTDNKSSYMAEALPLSKLFDEINDLPAPVDTEEILEWLQNFKDVVRGVSLLRFSNDSGKAFDLIRRMTKYNTFLKRDGSIITALKDFDGSIVTNPLVVSKKLVDSLKTGEDSSKKLHIPSESFQKHVSLELNEEIILPDLEIQDLESLLKGLKSGKCTLTSTIPDLWYTELAKDPKYSCLTLGNYRETLLRNVASLWNTQVLKKIPGIFEMKLIPLNKNHPGIPTVNDMRPIFATSATFKILEKRFTDSLTNFYLRQGVGSRFQTGFLPGLSTQINLLRLADMFQNLISNGLPRKERTVPFVLFIDFRQAYNSINLARTFSMMIEDGYPEQDVTFMKWLYSKQTAQTESSQFNPTIGVPQGGINSPILFDITLNYMMRNFREKIHHWVYNDKEFSVFKKQLLPNDDNTLAYADDLAFVLWLYEQGFGNNTRSGQLKLLDQFLTILVEVAQGWGLIVNWKKSGLMFLGLKKNFSHLITASEDNLLNNAVKEDSGVIIESKGKYRLVRKMVNPIPVVEVYRYLGVDVNGKMTFKNAFDFLKRKLNFLTYALYPIRSQGPNLRFDQNLWNTFARPLIDYYAPLAWKLGPKIFAKLLNLSRTSLRNFLGLTKGTPLEIVDCLMLYDVKEWASQSVRRWESQFRGYMKDGLCQKPNQDTNQPFYDLTLVSTAWLHVSNIYYSRVKCKLCSYFHGSKNTGCRLDSIHLNFHSPRSPLCSIPELLREVLQVSKEVQGLSRRINCLHVLDAQRTENDLEQAKQLVKKRELALKRWQALDSNLGIISGLMDICLVRGYS